MSEGSNVTGKPLSLLKAEYAEDLAALRAMLLIRRFEEKAGQLYGVGFIGGFCHLCIGQEAVAVGVTRARKPGDQIISTYRNHGLALAAGVDARQLMAELLGRAAGCCGGKGGSMHVFALEHGLYGGHGIVGATAPLGAGLAFANAYREDGRVTWCFLGDGAADQGQVFEAMNLSARMRLPVVFVIENNRGGAKADGDRGPMVPLSERGATFGIYGDAADGMDVEAVLSAAKTAGDAVRNGEGPRVLELRTERYRGHSVASPGKYQSGDAGGARRKPDADPIERVRARLLEAGVDEGDLRQLDLDVREEVAAAAEAAQAEDEPTSGALFQDVTAAG